MDTDEPSRMPVCFSLKRESCNTTSCNGRLRVTGLCPDGPSAGGSQCPEPSVVGPLAGVLPVEADGVGAHVLR